MGYVQEAASRGPSELAERAREGQRRNGRTDIQAALHSVVTGAGLFICVPPSEEEAAPIGSRCERKDRQKADLKGGSLGPAEALLPESYCAETAASALGDEDKVAKTTFTFQE